ncbi:MAG: hypothetical protein ABH807_00930 [Candidatus Shapirobacteria bacterium]
MKKKKILGPVLFLFLIAGLFFTLKSAQQRQEVRKQADTAGLIKFSLKITDSSSQAIPEALPGTNNLTAQVILDNPQNLTFKAAGVDIAFNPEVFTASDLKCGSQLSNALPANQITIGQIKLTCFQKEISLPPVSGTISLGTFMLSVKETAPAGPSSLTFSRTRLPQDKTGDNLADVGTPLSFMIASPTALVPTVIPTTTVTPNPVVPSPVPCVESGSPCRQNRSCCSNLCSQSVCIEANLY